MKTNFVWGGFGDQWVEEHRGQTIEDPGVNIIKPSYVEVDPDFGEALKDAGRLEEIRTLALKRGVPEHKVKDGFESNLMLFTGSTEARDRYGDRIQVDGWITDEYSLNPVFLGFHDYDAPAIGQALDVYRDVVTPRGKTFRFGEAEYRKAGDGKKRLRFLMLWAVDENPQAKILHGLYKGRDMRATSVGFIPGEVHVPGSDEERSTLDLGPMGVLHKKQTLLELSAVSVPALPEAIQEDKFEEYRKGIDDQELAGLAKLAEQIKALDADLAYAVRSYLPSKRKTVDVLPALGRGVVPSNVSTKLADKGTAWAKPNLSDFGIDSWDGASATDKRKVAGHFGWADASPASSFGQLKLPHHRASDGAVVFRGVAAAAGRFNQARIPSADGAKVKSHLRNHYRAFGEQPPAVLEAMHLDDDAMRKRIGEIDGGEPITEAELAGLRAVFDATPFEISLLREAVRTAGQDPEFELEELDAQFNAIQTDAGTLENDDPAPDATKPGDPIAAALDSIAQDLDALKGDTKDGDPDDGNAENRVVPEDVTQELADPESSWDPITEEAVNFGELDEEQRAVLAGFFAYSSEIPPTAFDELRLAHHSLPDGLVNLEGTREAMRMLLERDGEGADIPDDERKAVYDHLAKHLEDFGQDVPEFTDEQTEGNPKDPKNRPGKDDKKKLASFEPTGDASVDNLIQRALNDAIGNVVGTVKKAVLEKTGIEIDFDIDERGKVHKWRAVRSHSPEKAADDFKFSRAEYEKEVGDDIKLRRDTCLIYDDADPKNPKSYLFPHHQAKEGIPVVWSEVVKAMKRLIGKSLDGSIPDEVRRRAYVHLRNHYGQYEREAPAFRSLEQLAALAGYLRDTAVALAEADDEKIADVELALDLVYMGFQAANDKAFEIQSLSFPSDNWTKEDAIGYAKENGFMVDDARVQETQDAFILTVRDRSDFVSLSERQDDSGDAPVVIVGGRLRSGVGLVIDKLASLESKLDSGIKEIKRSVEARGVTSGLRDPKNGSDPFAAIYQQTEDALQTVERNIGGINKKSK